MPYASDNRISEDPIEGGIKITAAQYRDALTGMLDGKVVSIVDGKLVVSFPPEPEPEPEPEPIDPSLVPVALREVAGARLSVDKDNWDVTGVDRSKGILGAFLADNDVVWVFFDIPQPDTQYIVTPNEGVTKFPEYVEVSRPSLAEIVFIVQRVQ